MSENVLLFDMLMYTSKLQKQPTGELNSLKEQTQTQNP